MKQNRANKNAKEDDMHVRDMHAVKLKRRAATLERVRKHRAAKKSQQNLQNDEENLSTSLSEITFETYNTSQTLGKAVKRVKKALPCSPRKTKAILTHIVANLNETDKETLVNVVSQSKFKKKLNQPIEFYM